MISRLLNADKDRDLLEKIYKYENEVFGDAAVGMYNISPFAKYGRVYATYNENEIVSVIEIINSYNNISYIYGVSTNKKYRNQGYAKNLLQLAINDLVNCNTKEFELTVSTNNTIAINMYKNLGFIIVKLLENEYFDNEQRYLMRLEI